MTCVVHSFMLGATMAFIITPITGSKVEEFVSSPNMTHARKYIHRDERGARFLKFKTDSRDKMMINLEFSVPFLTVPLKQDDPTHPPAPIEVNVRGILMAAGLGAVASLVVPVLTGNPGPFSAFLPVPQDTPPSTPPSPPWAN